MNTWILVEDSYPTDNFPVWCYSRDAGVQMGHYNESHGRFYYQNGSLMSDVTHWIPFETAYPEPPRCEVTCTWTIRINNWGVWETSCGRELYMNLTPKQNGVNFCPNCGKVVDQKIVLQERKYKIGINGEIINVTR